MPGDDRNDATFGSRVRRYCARHPRLTRALELLVLPVEIAGKKAAFGCKMCGQCILHETGLTCPMGCPKTLRNGPCGGVRLDGHCEVIPAMMCVWVKAERRARWLPWKGAILRLQPALDWSRQGTSAWVNEILLRPERGAV